MSDILARAGHHRCEKIGLGGLYKIKYMNGIWEDAQRQGPIKLLELYAVFLSLRHFYKMGLLVHQHVLVHCDKACWTRSLPLLSLLHSLLTWRSAGLLSPQSEPCPRGFEPGPDMAPMLRNLEPVGVAPEREKLMFTGLPANVIDTIQSARAASTRSLYTFKWRIYEVWCLERH